MKKEKINRKVVEWVLDIYLNYPYTLTYICLWDFKEKYKVSYPTMYKYLPLFFKISDRAYVPFKWWAACTLVKLPDLELLFNTLKNLNHSRSFLNFLSLFVSNSAAAEIIVNYLENFKSNYEEEWKIKKEK